MFFFFFQAEDGIRDGRVTGVQTCALPILRAAGISNVVSITSDPVGAITQKVRDMHLSIPVASDPGLAVSHAYHANQYGMMGTSRDGHTFILVGPNGLIRWRADYGGPPKYTMFLPTSALLADIKAGEHPSR